jgi:DNA (cytosine-5)-methyltransferase 1
MLNRFITRIHKYSVKRLKNGAARVYIQNADALQQSGFLKGVRIRVITKKGRIEITLDPDGAHSIMDTGRGELLELKNKATGESLDGHEFVSVTFRQGKIVITSHGLSESQARREKRFITAVSSGKPLRTGSFFSGTGMLSYHLHQGLKHAGIPAKIAFANDNNELAMACNLAGNPIWAEATDDALAIIDEIDNVPLSELNEVDVVEVGYPCVGFSTLAQKEKLDLKHPHCGLLFISLLNALKALNPAVILFENTPRFGQSETLSLITRSLPGYHFEQRVFNGHDFGELEARKRVCVIGVSKGLPAFDLSTVLPDAVIAPKTVADFLLDIPVDSPLFRTMDHVKARDNMPHVGYRNCLYHGSETAMVTLPASYANPKAGTPMIAHPSNPQLQRQVQVEEHIRLRELPASLAKVIMAVKEGRHPLVSTRGSITACHRMLGNGVSKRIWSAIGEALGNHFRTKLGPQQACLHLD